MIVPVLLVAVVIVLLYISRALYVISHSIVGADRNRNEASIEQTLLLRGIKAVLIEIMEKK